MGEDNQGQNDQEIDQGSHGDQGQQKPDNQEAYYRRQYEKAMRELEKSKKDRMSESELVKAEREEFKSRAEAAESKLSEYRFDAVFKTAAEKHSVHDLDSVLALSRGKVKMDEDGNLIGAESFLKSLRQSKPHLFKVPATGTGGGRPPGSTPSNPANKYSSINDEIRRKTRGIS